MNDRLTAALADRYRIERELGQGGMATVYLAQDLKHEREVAIKVLREDLSASLGAGRFLREIKIAAQLQHPHILPLLDSGEADGFLFFVMPYIKGQSLRERLAREGELPVHEAVRLLVEVVDALVEAHEHGVVHRDIKPDNVMLSGRHALVTDFGVAKAISEATGRNTITTLGVAVGTPTYMSPEQAAADPHVDHRSDIYSVGVMAYEMLSGKPPFTGSTPQQVLAAHVTEAPDSVAKRRPAIAPALEQIVMRCLAKRPADRFQTAAELHAALEPLATPSTGITPTQTRPVIAWTGPATSSRWLLPAGAVVIVILAAAVARSMAHRAPPGNVIGDAPRVQATFSGRAEAGALSPDGQRVAFGERGCDSAGRCTMSLVVQDVGGFGRLQAVTGMAGLYGVKWSPNGRELLVVATSADGVFGNFVVPSLGGVAPRFINSAESIYFGAGDSIMVATEFGPNHYGFFATHLLDRQSGDTLRFARPGLTAGSWVPSFDGRHIALSVRNSAGASFLLVIDRKGTPLDSLPQSRGIRPLGWSSQGRLVLQVQDTANREFAAIVDRSVSAAGIIGREQRILVPSQLMANPGVSDAGVYYLAGPEESVLYEATRPAVFSANLALRRVTSSTALLSMLMAGDGKSHLVLRTPRVDRAQAVGQLSILPFGGGNERPLTAGIRGVIATSRTVKADAMVVVHRDGPNARITSFDLASGRSTELGVMSDTTAMVALEVLRDGSLAWYDPDDPNNVIQVRDSAGARRTISLPNTSTELLEDSFYGDGIVGWGWTKPSYDTLVVFHVAPGASTARVLLRTVQDNVNGMHWTPNGTIELIFSETSHSSAIYSLDPRTLAFRRVAPLRLPDITALSFSIDGLRLNLRTNEAHRDLWIATAVK
jgi:tRNA A-37 threonylcarbamoyl transferase component Bud32